MGTLTKLFTKPLTQVAACPSISVGRKHISRYVVFRWLFHFYSLLQCFGANIWDIPYSHQFRSWFPHLWTADPTSMGTATSRAASRQTRHNPVGMRAASNLFPFDCGRRRLCMRFISYDGIECGQYMLTQMPSFFDKFRVAHLVAH